MSFGSRLFRGRQQRMTCYLLIMSLIFMTFGTHVVLRRLLGEHQHTSWMEPVTALTRSMGLVMAGEPGTDTKPVQLVSDKKKRLPRAIVFGVSKCGTAALVHFLRLHPQIVAPKSEVHYFNQPDVQESMGLGWYIQQMPESSPDQVTIVKSPDYFQSPETPKMVYSINKSMKLLLLLRDPTRRLISEYMQLQDKSNGNLPSFEDWVIDKDTGEVNTKVKSVSVSTYSVHLERWYQQFPAKEFHVIDASEFRKKPIGNMKEVESFLDLQPFFSEENFYFNHTKGFHCIRSSPDEKGQCLGATKGRTHVDVKREVIDKLNDFFEPFNQRLYKLLNRTFDWPDDE